MSLINSKGTQENSPVFNTLKEEIGQWTAEGAYHHTG